MKLLLAGEGANELGGWHHEEPYRTDEPGVIEALLKKVHPHGWAIVHAVKWHWIHKYCVGMHGAAEKRNIEYVHHKAKKLGLDAVVFVRDRDGKKNHKRQRDIEYTIESCEQTGGPAIIGGMAIEKLEAWILALCGEHNSESMNKPENRLADREDCPKNTAEMVEVVEGADLDRIPSDARSLRAWLDRARSVLGPQS
ncbi:MAG: hypothetical protein JXR96_23230 [Deltaproteobacteria bacterium]|nr:hypothetical protein [Deltaproteobacteria bacterium]